jgi:hypothetical protein
MTHTGLQVRFHSNKNGGYNLLKINYYSCSRIRRFKRANPKLANGQEAKSFLLTANPDILYFLRFVLMSFSHLGLSSIPSKTLYTLVVCFQIRGSERTDSHKKLPLGRLNRTVVLGSTRHLTKMSTKYLPGGTRRLERKDDNLIAICELII